MTRRIDDQSEYAAQIAKLAPHDCVAMTTLRIHGRLANPRRSTASPAGGQQRQQCRNLFHTARRIRVIFEQGSVRHRRYSRLMGFLNQRKSTRPMSPSAPSAREALGLSHSFNSALPYHITADRQSPR
jgi:hypothetical protein